VDSTDGQFVIIAPIHGSPAEEAGILAGDLVLAVNGQEVTGMAEWEVISLIRGPAGTAVTVTIQHADETDPVDIEIVRRRIDIESVLWARVPGVDVVQVQITQFADDTGEELHNALNTILSDRTAPVRGIILDVRNNPGGYLQEALRTANQFLDEGLVILHEQDAQDNLVTYRARGRGLGRQIPMVVLVNPGSASAAEILAGALQENGRAKLVGEPTVGTGTVLRPFRLSDGSMLRLGVTNWLTPNQHLIKGEGIQPDILIEQAPEVELINSTVLPTLSETDVRTHADRQFQTALLLLQLQLNRNSQAQTPATAPVP
jgi:carboxyl-terminal processing protease